MNDWIRKIDELDLSLFEAIPSQTSAEDRRSLLAVQRATARRYKEKQYVYLEIGSHLGGTIQPHFVDGRCRKIYSIDPRPSQQPDDRSPGAVYRYENNSTERMLNLLRSAASGDVGKVECFDLDASKVALGKITESPQVVFIDGEHTHSAVLSDFDFCSKVVSERGTILFHDSWIIFPAILRICNMLDKNKRRYLPLKLEGTVFAIFFDPVLVHTDPYLASMHKQNRCFLFNARVKHWLKQHLPSPLLSLVKKLRNAPE